MTDRDQTHPEPQAFTSPGGGTGRFCNVDPGQHFPGVSGVLSEQAMAQTRMAVALVDPRQDDMPLVFVTRAFERLTGYSQDQAIGRNCRFLQGPEIDPETVAKIRHAILNEDVIVVELLNCRHDGSTFWNAVHLGPIYDETGELIYYLGPQWDVSKVHAARADEAHARMMAREFSHRMKNMFAVIGGLVTVTGRTCDIQPQVAEIDDRIRALALAFETTLDDAARGSADLQPTIKAVLDPYDPAGDGIRLRGPDLRVDPILVSTIGLALHELATNGIKHGALSGGTGQSRVEWGADESGGLSLLWTGTGGPEVAPPGRRGIGVRHRRDAAGHHRRPPEPRPDRGRASCQDRHRRRRESRMTLQEPEDTAPRILILEDEPLILLELSDAIRDEGAVAVPVNSVEKAICAIDREAPDAAIPDLNLGRGTTCEAVAARLQRLRIPFLIHSGDLVRQGELIARINAEVIAKPAASSEVAARALALVRDRTPPNRPRNGPPGGGM